MLFDGSKALTPSFKIVSYIYFSRDILFLLHSIFKIAVTDVMFIRIYILYFIYFAEAPGASFTEVMAKRADLDMQAKMREDPLYAIR